MQLYTFVGDVVLDPFMGTGATAVAAVRDGRRYAGYELSEEYAALAESRIEQARAPARAGTPPGVTPAT
jgi:site-specific DNA-methyltransferase (adenine-specific)